METEEETRPSIMPPWAQSDFLSEQGLKQSQEYFFQTHATNSKMMAEGREAQGVMKSFTRRKMEKEMGEDFKMYTGEDLGSGGGGEESKGIRGELNNLLKEIHRKVANGKPGVSAIQDDLEILKNPLGGLEACYGVVLFYEQLNRHYASFAANRRQVLKSVMDEELFKWIWRSTYALLTAPKESLPEFTDRISSPTLPFIPLEKVRASSIDKLMEVGVFLLSKSMSSSHLRFPLCFYFILYVRQIQYRLLPVVSRNLLDEIYKEATKGKTEESIENVLTAVDVILNMKGSSVQSFDDVLKDEEKEIPKFIPSEEAVFVSQFIEFGEGRIKGSLKKFLPPPSQSELVEDKAVSLMPLLLILRTQSMEVGHRILETVPGPALNMIRNRLSFGNPDEVSRRIADWVGAVTHDRQGRGETYNLQNRVGGVTETVRSKPIAGGGGVAAPAAKPSGPGHSAAAHPASTHSATAKAAHGGIKVGQISPDTGGGSGGAQGERAKASSSAEGGGKTSPNLAKRLIISWRENKGKILVISISPEEIINAVGADVRFLGPWVVFALQTGQVFSIKGKLTREVAEEILKTLMGSIQNPPGPIFSNAERDSLAQSTKGMPPKKLLITLMQQAVGPTSQNSRDPGEMGENIMGLEKQLGETLGEFLRNPVAGPFKEVLADLPPGETKAASVLHKVARSI